MLLPIFLQLIAPLFFPDNIWFMRWFRLNMGISYAQKWYGEIVGWRSRLAISHSEEIVFYATPNIFAYYLSPIPTERYMVGAVVSFEYGDELCSKMVR